MKNTVILLVIIFSITTVFISCKCKNTSQLHERLIDRYVKFWNTGEFDGIEDILSENFELRRSPKFESEVGIETFKENILSLRKAYPDFYLAIDEAIYSANAVAGRWTITATNTRSSSNPEASKNIKVSGMSILHFSEGKIKDEWIANNDYYWLQQLGYTFTAPNSE